VEYLDFAGDTPNDVLERNGQRVSATHRWESWSPGCAALQVSVPGPQGQACAAD